ncbi:hypothetical protein J6590_020702 [Homalodisca vitripennis]|nr:hypothetical protein J6590_020702 [Homalodisca vitripennis]
MMFSFLGRSPSTLRHPSDYMLCCVMLLRITLSPFSLHQSTFCPLSSRLCNKLQPPPMKGALEGPTR